MLENNAPTIFYDITLAIFSFDSLQITCNNNRHRREHLNEAHNYMFCILENYCCWRFHGSGVIGPSENVGLILFCTRRHRDIFWGRQWASVCPIYVRKYHKYTIHRWTVVCTMWASAVISALTVVGFMRKNSFEKRVTRSSILFICNI